LRTRQTFEQFLCENRKPCYLGSVVGRESAPCGGPDGKGEGGGNFGSHRVKDWLARDVRSVSSGPRWRWGSPRDSAVPAVPFYSNNGFRKTETHATVNFAMTTNCRTSPSALALRCREAASGRSRGRQDRRPLDHPSRRRASHGSSERVNLLFVLGTFRNRKRIGWEPFREHQDFEEDSFTNSQHEAAWLKGPGEQPAWESP